MAKEWRFGIIGVGMAGEWHVRTVPKVPGAKLVAISDLILDRPKAAIAKYNLPEVPLYTDYTEMLRKEKLDVVNIAVPSGDHMRIAMDVMNAGCNVITEKPMEIQLDRIDRMVETAAKKKLRLAAIFQNRWNLANRALHDAVAAGRFGRMTYAGCFTPWHRTDMYYEDGGWRGTWALDGGGAIMNQSVHAIDLLQWIVGPVKQVSGHSSSRIHDKIEVEDTGAAVLEFENGAYGTILGTTAMYPGGAVRIWVGGENGTAISENGLHTFKFRDERPEDKELMERLNPAAAKNTGGGASPSDISTDLHGLNINAILRSWEEGKDAETCGAEARKAVAIILALYESSRKGGAPVQVSK